MVENMSHFECAGCKEKHMIYGKEAAEFAKANNVSHLGNLPFVADIMNGSEQGVPVVLTNSAISDHYDRIVEGMLANISDVP